MPPVSVVEVAAAVLQQADGTFLLAQRPTDKIWAGYWEFPGGKLEDGETARDALIRELQEELGIEVLTAYRWITREFTYPHARVRLHFFRVTAWRGTLHPHEGQQFVWQTSRPTVSPILPANAPILRALTLPTLYAISNAGELGEDEFMTRLEARLKAGLNMVQLREKTYRPNELEALVLRMMPLMHRHGARLIVNADIEWAHAIGADGVQLNAKQVATLKQRPDLPWCGASCHNAVELRQAEVLGCDFALLSPVLPTQSHPGEPTLGWEKFDEIIASSAIPVYALGGLTPEDMTTAWQHGAHGISLLRQAWA